MDADLLTRVNATAQALQARGWLMATAESCTGGLIAAQATSLSGSSAWFDRGFVTYSNAAKREQLGVGETLLQRFGAVSEEVVRAMALGALTHSQAQISVAVTGIAGPTGAVPGKPVGTVWIGWAWRVSASSPPQVIARLHHFDGDRQAVRAATAREAWAGCEAQLLALGDAVVAASQRLDDGTEAPPPRIVNLAWCAEMPPAFRQTWADQLMPRLEAVARAERAQLVWLTDHRLHEADIAIVAQPPQNAWAQLIASPRLRWVQSLWAGVDRLLGWSPLPAQVELTRMVDPALRDAMVGSAVWAVIGLHRGFDDYRDQQARAQWLPRPQRQPGECEVLILGRGALGGAVGQQLRALGYRVVVWGGASESVVATQDALLAWDVDGQGVSAWQRAEIVVNLLPLTPATRGLLSAPLLGRLKPGAHLVNLARGGHVVEDDLLRALEAGQVGRAVLDVFETEPLPPDHPFWRHPRITVWPHVAALTDPHMASTVVADNLQRWLRGEPLAHVVDRRKGY
jgi:glyoxylate/hydroxypyruvate reductase